MKLQNKICIVTGASKGIGKETAFDLALRKKSRVVLAARSLDLLERHVALIKERGGEALAVACDVSEKAECFELAAKTVSHFGRVDVLINNAGFGHYASVEKLKQEDVESVFATNVWGAMHCVQAVLPQMKSQGSGHIVNVSSVVGWRSVPFMSAYCMSKFAMNAMDESLRIELAGSGVNVSLVCPGLTRTEFQTNAGKVGYKAPVSNEKGMDPVKVARAIARTIEKRKSRVYLTLEGKLLVAGQRFCPSLLDWAMRRVYAKRRLDETSL